MEVHRVGSRITAFACNYRARIQGRWVEVVRYDTAHGYLHVHKFWRAGKAQIERVAPLRVREGVIDLATALATAEEDLASRWQRYRSRMERRTHG